MTVVARRDTFQAIADPTRRQIITLLARQPLNLNAIAENFEMSRPAISQHITILTECGLIVVRQQGRERFCFVQPEKLDEVTDWISDFRKKWELRFDKLDNLLLDLQSPKKSNKNDNKNQKATRNPRRAR